MHRLFALFAPQAKAKVFGLRFFSKSGARARGEKPRKHCKSNACVSSNQSTARQCRIDGWVSVTSSGGTAVRV